MDEKAVGGGGISFNGLIHTFFYIDTRQLHTRTPHTATCDGVEYFFAKGGIHGVAMAGNRNHASSHSYSYTEVISRALIGVQTVERTYLKENYKN